MNRTFIVRALALYLPAFAALVLWTWRKPARQEATGALLASAWNIPFLLALNLLAHSFGWWHFHVSGAVFLGVPVDLWLGWSLLWGCVAALLFRHTPVWLACCWLALFDLLAMPLCTPVVVLGKFWLVGELVGVACSLAPALYFARWTCHGVHVSWRATLQFLTFSGIFLIGIVVAIEPSRAPARFEFRSTAVQIILQVLFLLALPALSAVQEFAAVGHGTPLPYDAPVHLVTSGIYSYVANPMQLSTTLLLFTLGVVLHSLWLVLAGLISMIYCFGLAAWDEGGDLQQRYGSALIEYRKHVRNWVPRWRPYLAKPARIYLSEDCFKCSQLARFLRGLSPEKLVIMAAEEHPVYDLERMTYESADGNIREQGVAALARALEHVNFAWTFGAVMMRLPLVNQMLQAIVDASGGGPFRVTRRTCGIPLPHQQETHS